jgi:predicted MPP superfamily phosphohydrolase
MWLRRALVPLLILGLLHLYIAARLLAALPLGAVGQFVGVGSAVASFVLIPLALFARSFRNRVVADRLAGLGLFLAGYFSSLLVFTVLRDVTLLLALPFLSSARLNDWTMVSAVAALGAAIFATLVGFVNARRVARVVGVDIPLKDLPIALSGFTIAQITDLHVGPTIKRGYVDGVVNAVNALGADVIAVTGDIVDGPVAELGKDTAPLARLSARHGTYFVTGNHEYYAGEREWTAEISRLGLRVLMNEHVVIERDGARIVLAGVADYGAHHFNPSQRSDPEAAVRDAPADAEVRILLAHQPRSAPAAAAAGFHLQLSGHTHGGQFWPWNYFVPLQQPFTAGLHRLRQLWVYVSRGTGYWGPPKRFGSPSEITLLRLIRAPG